MADSHKLLANNYLPPCEAMPKAKAAVERALELDDELAAVPTTVKFRNEAHFVEELGSARGTPIGRMLSIEQITPNPNQPRQQMGDLGELTASIAHELNQPLSAHRRQRPGCESFPRGGEPRPRRDR